MIMQFHLQNLCFYNYCSLVLIFSSISKLDVTKISSNMVDYSITPQVKALFSVKLNY